MVCGAVKTLRGQRFKVDSVLYEGLSYVATLKKSLFTNEAIVNALCALLKRDIPPPSASSFKNIIPKTNIIVSLLSISILTRAFQDVKRWPDILMKVLFYFFLFGVQKGKNQNMFQQWFCDISVAESFSIKIMLLILIQPSLRVDD